MVALPKYLQDKAEAGEIDTEPRGRGPVEDGYYVMKLTNFEEDEKAAGPGINADFTITAGKLKGTVLKYNWFSFSEGGAWKPLQFLQAAGYTADSQFEEPMDDEAEVIAYVAKETQTQGKNKGKFVNNIREFIAVSDDNLKLLDD